MFNITEICKKYNRCPQSFTRRKIAAGKFKTSKVRQGGSTLVDDSLMFDFAIWVSPEGKLAAMQGRHVEWLKQNGV